MCNNLFGKNLDLFTSVWPKISCSFKIQKWVWTVPSTIQMHWKSKRKNNGNNYILSRNWTEMKNVIAFFLRQFELCSFHMTKSFREKLRDVYGGKFDEIPEVKIHPRTNSFRLSIPFFYFWITVSQNKFLDFLKKYFNLKVFARIEFVSLRAFEPY